MVVPIFTQTEQSVRITLVAMRRLFSPVFALVGETYREVRRTFP